MSTLAVRSHLDRDPKAAVSVRGRHLALDASAPNSGISVRTLLTQHTAYRLRLGSLKFKKATFRLSMAAALDGGTPGPPSASVARSGPFNASLAGGKAFNSSLAGTGPFDGSVLNHPGQDGDIFIPETVGIRLEVWIDDEYSHFIRFEVSKDGAYTLPDVGPPIEFRRLLVLRLFDERLEVPFGSGSSTPRDKIVREYVFESPQSGAITRKFRVESGDYSLNCAVDRVPGLPPSAAELVYNFRARRTAGKWAHFSRGTVADELDARLKNPELIRQGPTPLCGPSSVIHAMARKSPRRYVRAVTQLFERGYCDTKFGRIGSSESLRKAALPTKADRDPIGPADWILASAMRNDANLFLDVEDGSKLAGSTAVWAIQTWLRELLGYEGVHTHTSTSLGKLGINFGAGGKILGGFGLLDWLTDSSPTSALNAGTSAIRRGGVCLMMVNSNLLDNGVKVDTGPTAVSSSTLNEGYVSVVGALQAEDFIPTVATHWIALWESGPEARVKITGKSATFGYFSWGAYYTVTVPYSTLEGYLFLVVTATQA